jgi:predicted secreted protein
MNTILLLLLAFAISSPQLAIAGRHQVIDTLGVSSKGQYVALEEYGYHPERHRYYVRVTVMNVWKKEYAGTPFEIEVPALRASDLQLARARVRSIVKEDLKQFGISI